MVLPHVEPHVPALAQLLPTLEELRSLGLQRGLRELDVGGEQIEQLGGHRAFEPGHGAHREAVEQLEDSLHGGDEWGSRGFHARPGDYPVVALISESKAENDTWP